MPHVDVWLYDYAADPHPLPRGLLTAAEHRRAQQLGDRFIRLRGTLRRLLGHYTRHTTITRGLYGKPAVRGVQFNMAYTTRYAIYAFSREAPLGVDIEAVRPHNADIEALLHPAEREQWGRLPHHARRTAFFRLWVRKEATLKAEGVGLSRDPSTLCVGLSGAPLVDDRWAITDVPIPVGWVASLAAGAERHTTHIKHI